MFAPCYVSPHIQTCYAVTPNTLQWYRINTNKITDNHKTAICNDTTVNMVPLPPTEQPEMNPFETFVRLSHSQNQRDLPDDIQTQTAPRTSIITNNSIGNAPKSNMILSHDQSTIILQQFSMITEKVKNFTKCLVILQRSHKHNTAQENTGKPIEHAISQALTKAQSTTTPVISIDTRNVGTNYANLIRNKLDISFANIQPYHVTTTGNQHTSNSQTLWRTYIPTNLYKPTTPQSDPFWPQSVSHQPFWGIKMN